MARNPEEEKRIGELIRQAAAARSHLAEKAVKLRRNLDVPSRLRSALGGHPGRWMAGSLVSGMAASLLMRRKPKHAPARSKGLLFAILAMLFSAAKPLLKAWLAGRLKELLLRSHSTISPQRPVARPLP
ncbi:MAG TPA: hypothetical protein VLO11_09155 [Luteolibacter sp.]|nr:hypothetical protein [Luteolibacter sp.]